MLAVFLLLSSIGQRNAAVLSVQQSWEVVLSPTAVSLLLLELKTNYSDPSVQEVKGTQVLEQLRDMVLSLEGNTI